MARARDLITEHPTWGRRRINDQLRKEFGEGVRTIDLAREQDRLFPMRPKPKGKGQLGWLAQRWQEPEAAKYKPARDVVGFIDGAHILRSAGFLPFEISGWRDANGRWRPGILQAQGVVDLLNSDALREMCHDRRNWVRMMRRAGLTDLQIVDLIRSEYAHDPKANPFDHLRIAYGKLLRDKLNKSPDAFAKRLGKSRGTEADIQKGMQADRRLGGHTKRTQIVARRLTTPKRTTTRRAAPPPLPEPKDPWTRGSGKGWQGGKGKAWDRGRGEGW